MTDSRRSLHLLLITTGVLALLLGLMVILTPPGPDAGPITETRYGPANYATTPPGSGPAASA
jgi:hypothetical protein